MPLKHLQKAAYCLCISDIKEKNRPMSVKKSVLRVGRLFHIYENSETTRAHTSSTYRFNSEAFLKNKSRDTLPIKINHINTHGIVTSLTPAPWPSSSLLTITAIVPATGSWPKKSRSPQYWDSQQAFQMEYLLGI
jgi:hypothetical protein